jgi:transposase-like protein
LDTELSSWRNRPLGACPYMILDARYEKVRQGGRTYLKVCVWVIT